MNRSLISVIIPVRQLSYYLLSENLPIFDKQTCKQFEVIVLPNQHAQYDLILLKKYQWLRIIPTGKITRPAEKRDRGVKNAKGEIIAFIDDDAYPTEDWLENAVKLFKEKKVAALCGPGILPPNTNRWEKLFDEILKTWVGSGGYSYRFIPKKEKYIDDYPSMNFLIKKKIFQKLGGFNSDYWPGEDSKLCEDLVYKEKEKILYSPLIVIYHHRRNNLKDYLKQHANYGFHRGAFFSHGDRNSRRISYLMPTFFVFYIIFTILFTILFSLYSILNTKYFILYTPLLTYFFLGFVLILKSFLNTRDLFLAVLTFPVLFLTHLTYGIMFIKGLLKGMKHKNNIYAK